MTEPLDVTFRVLRDSATSEVADVILAAVLDEFDEIAVRAACTVLARGSNRDNIALLQRLPQCRSAVVEAVAERLPTLRFAFHHGLYNGNSEQINDLLLTMQLLDAWTFAPLLVGLSQSTHAGISQSAGETLLVMADRLHDQAQSTAHDVETREHVRGATEAVLRELASAFNRTNQIACLEPYVETALILGRHTHPCVRAALWQGPADLRAMASRLLEQSVHPAVMRQIVDAFGQNYPHPRAFEIVQQRRDLEFVAFFLSQLPANLSQIMSQNLRQFTKVGFLTDYDVVLNDLPAGLQPAFVAFAHATKIPSDLKQSIDEWILRHGSADGRAAALQRATTLDEQLVQSVVLDGLESEDTSVQVWALSQVRQAHLPEGWNLLIERLDSPIAEVRDAARRELADFNLERVLELIERLDPGAAREAARLMLKVDHEAIPKLHREMSSPVRHRRLKGAQAALKLGLASSVEAELLEMASDPDPLFRRVAAEVLLTVQTPLARQTLEAMRGDPSPRVRSVLAEQRLDTAASTGEFLP
ncbi:MAG: hypothetical protein KF777_07275 [Planctomycetaceae bacterium]|nr:hypothetical protein [Planctomycetaceae bacterium]